MGVPKPIVKTIPSWYRKSDKYLINKENGTPWEDPYIGGRIPNWKSCPAVFDVMGSGYCLRTPCELEFYYDVNGKISVRPEDNTFLDFCTSRDPMDDFKTPMGYDNNHFAWWMDWGVQVPEGYSVLFTNPMNRFELPFISTSGIIDCDKISVPGTVPFFLFKGWTGVLPAGTPYLQLIPFKRDDWESEINIKTEKEIYEDFMYVNNKYRVPDGGVYKNEVWTKRKYD